MGQSLTRDQAVDLIEKELHIYKPHLIPDGDIQYHDHQLPLCRVICLVDKKWFSLPAGETSLNSIETSGNQLSLQERLALLQSSQNGYSDKFRRISVTVIRKPIRKVRVNVHFELLNVKRCGEGGYGYQAAQVDNTNQGEKSGTVMKDGLWILNQARYRIKQDAIQILYFIYRVKQDGSREIHNLMVHHVLHEMSTKYQRDIKSKFFGTTDDRPGDFQALTEELFVELLKKTYGATIKKLSVSDSDAYSRTTQANGMFAQNDAWWSSWHLLPLLGAFESDNAYYLIEPALQFTLHDMLTFSPVIMSNSIAKFLFVIYQLIHIFLTFSAKGFTISPSLNFKNLFVTDSLWLLTSGLRIDANDVQLDRDTPNISLTNETLFKTPLLLEPPLVCKENLLDYTVQWVNGQISNFDYLIILNCLAGRRVCDPSYHPVFPWIMDFSKPDDCFRDLSKSKYRLCKGDMQLDFTYSSETRSHSRKDKVFDEHAPHHIPDDPLTSITYYVYLARRIPKDVLCTHVRTKWVPEEYPASMERLYHWTPEECIPEFFTDPGIFQSIHSDLADLQLPSWADSAEAFVAHHRKILEGPHVSRNLHSWIDLIFGHMLSGTSAVGAKNIYLSLVDNHSHAVNHGVIQLFPKPHPKRKVIHTSDAAPAASNASSLTASTTVTRNENFVEEQTDNAQDGGMFDYFNNEVQGIDVEDSVKRKVSGTLRRDFMSVDSAVDLIEGKDDLEPYLKEAGAEPSVPLLPTILKQKLDILLETSSVDSKESSEDSLIKLPKGMNMIEDLERIEKLLKFEASVCPPDEFGVGEHKFGSIFDGIDEDSIPTSTSLSTSSPSCSNLKLLICLIIELVLSDYTLTRSFSLSLEERFAMNVELLKSQNNKFPSWLEMILKDLIKSAQKVTVQDDGEEYAINRCFADPPILLNSGINIFSFPKYFLSLHKVLSVLYSQNLAFSTLHDSFSGSMNSVFQPIPNYLPPGPGNIIETAQMLPPLFEELDQEGVDLLLVFLKPQFENPDTKLAAFKHLFHPVGQALGRQKAIKTFFKGLQALYDNIDINDVEEAQILDQDYLSKIITVFGLDCFLVQFSPFVLEVLVGGLQSLPQKTTKPDENSLGQQSEEGEFSNENMAETRKVSEENPDQDLSCEDNVDKQNTRKLRDALQLDFEESLSPKVGAIDADTPWKTGIDMAKLAAAFDTIHESFEDDLWRESSFNSSYEANSQGSDAMTGALALEPKIVNTTTDIPVRDDLNLLHEDNLQSVEIPSVLENKNNVDFLQSDPQNSAFVNKVKGFDDGLPDKSSVIDTNSNNDLFLNGGKLNGSNILLDTDNIGESDEVPSEVSNKEPDFHPLTQQTEDACNGSQALLEHSDDEQEHDMESKAERPNNSGSTEEIFNGTADDNTGFVDERMTDFDNAGGSTSQLSDKLTPNNRTEGAANSSVTELVDFVSDHQSYLQLPRPSSDYGDRAFRTDSQESPYIILDGNEGDVSRVEVPDDVIDLTIDNINPPVSKRDSFTKRRYSYQSDSSVFEVNPQQLALTSLKWIIPWLGPILTSKYVVKPILKRLPRLFQLLRNKDADQDCIQNETAGKLRNIMDCLVEVVMVYGEEIIFGYFIPYAIKAVKATDSVKLVSSSLDTQMMAGLLVLQKTLPMTSAKKLAAQMERLSTYLFQPLLRLLSALTPFQGTSQSRTILAQTMVDLLALLSRMLSRTVAREFMTPLLQRFFSCFDGIYQLERKPSGESDIVRKFSGTEEGYMDAKMSEDSRIEGGSAQAPSTGSATNEYTQSDVVDKRPFNESEGRENNKYQDYDETERSSLYKDLYDTFTPSLAYYSYVLFCRVLGDYYMESTLYNSELIWQLCTNHDERLTLTDQTEKESTATVILNSDLGSIAAEVREKKSGSLSKEKSTRSLTFSDSEDLRPIYSSRSHWQHLDGEWLELWKNSIESRDYEGFQIQEKKLQTYAGHSSAVRDFYAPDNEHYFLSASRDKTVKLWLLKNHGNGTAQLGCSRTYDEHTRPVFAVQSIEVKRLAVSCDGSVHFWDPIVGTAVTQVDLGKNNSAISLRTFPAPHTTVAVATAEGTVRLYDVRQKRLCDEWKVSPNTGSGTVRCLTVNERGSWMAAGFSNGVISVLDLKTGILRGQWRAHDAEILQLETYDDHSFLTSSTDLSMKMWNEDGSFAFRLRSLPEAVHSLMLRKDHAFWATVNNRVGIHQVIENTTPLESKRLSQDTFKGNISKFTVLPINKLYLIGNENGNVTLFA